MNAKARIGFFAVAGVCFYLAELLLFVSLSSVLGAALLCAGFVMLCVGTFAGRKAPAGKEVWLENSCRMDSAAAVHL